jgi:hypothetical protein
MNPVFTGLLVFGCVFGAALLAMRLRAALPQHHLSADTKDTVKLATGLVATMTALVLGLLIASAKGSYDTARSEMTQMAAKFVFLDRILANYGPEAAEPRTQLRQHGRTHHGSLMAGQPIPTRRAGPRRLQGRGGV